MVGVQAQKQEIYSEVDAMDAIEADEGQAEAFMFPQGLAGFADDTRYAFLYEGHGDIVCMQSLNSIEATFLMTPWDEDRLGASPKLSADQRACLDLLENDQPLWMLVLNPFADKHWVVANLRAPVAINESKRRGIQCIQADPSLELRYPWMPQPEKKV